MTVAEAILAILTLLLNGWFFLVKRRLRSDHLEVSWVGSWFTDVDRAWRLYMGLPDGARRRSYAQLFFTGAGLFVVWLTSAILWMR